MTERGAIGGNVSPGGGGAPTRTRPDAAARGARQEAAGSPRLAALACGTPESPVASLRAPVEPTRDSQEGRILAALRAGHHLTPLIALGLLNCLSLSQRVSILRRNGHDIKKRMVRVGTRKWVCEYRIDS